MPLAVPSCALIQQVKPVQVREKVSAQINLVRCYRHSCQAHQPKPLLLATEGQSAVHSRAVRVHASGRLIQSPLDTPRHAVKWIVHQTCVAMSSFHRKRLLLAACCTSVKHQLARFRVFKPRFNLDRFMDHPTRAFALSKSITSCEELVARTSEFWIRSIFCCLTMFR